MNGGMADDRISLYGDDYVTLTFSAREGFFRFVRLSKPYESVDAARQSYESMIGIMPAFFVSHKAPRLLVDMRLAPARNDPAFEEMQRGYRQLLLKRFVRVATLLHSRAGLLHVQRYGREDGRPDAHGFQDERSAVHYLQTGEVPTE